MVTRRKRPLWGSSLTALSKLILYLYRRHDSEFKYLIRGSELPIAKRCDLHLLPPAVP
jgi:hypothetical protein